MPGSSLCQDAVCIQEHGGPVGVEQLSIAPNAIVSEHQIHLDYWRGASCHFTSRITPGQTTWDRSGTSYPSHSGPPPPLASCTCQNLPSHHRVKPAAGRERHISGLVQTSGGPLCHSSFPYITHHSGRGHGHAGRDCSSGLCTKDIIYMHRICNIYNIHKPFAATPACSPEHGLGRTHTLCLPPPYPAQL